MPDKGRAFASVCNKKGHSVESVLFYLFTSVRLLTQEVGAQTPGALQGLLKLPFLNLRLVPGK